MQYDKAFLFAALLMPLPLLAGGLDHIRLPAGFRITIYADPVPGARSMVLGDDGTLFVGSRRQGQVYAVTDTNGDHKADEVRIIARGLYMPNGVAFRNGSLYVAEVSRILRFDRIETRLDHPPRPVVINDTLPDKAHHGWRYLAFGPDGWLYVSIGAPCNVCNEYGQIIRMRADGSGRQVYARGVRNSVGFDWHPDNGELWFTDNGRDWLGDDSPPDELNRAERPGLHFGFPYCHGGDIADPQFGEQRACSEFTPPEVRFGAHVAPLGIRFYDGTLFPENYRGQALVAQHGSWNRSQKVGYRIMRVDTRPGRARETSVFAEGWLQAGEKVSGRPVDLLVMPDGALLVSDDHAGRIYRISYHTEP
jgi:glucose/arabinose dehydrogenase